MSRKKIEFSKILQKNLSNLSSNNYYISGHSSYINSLDINSKSTKIITSSSDEYIKLWSLKTYYILSEFHQEKTPSNFVIFFTNKFAISTTISGSISIINLKLNQFSKTKTLESSIILLNKIESKNLILLAVSHFSILILSFPHLQVQSVLNCKSFKLLKDFKISKDSATDLDWLSTLSPLSNGDQLIISMNYTNDTKKSNIFIYDLITSTRLPFCISNYHVYYLTPDKSFQRIFYATDEKFVRCCFFKTFTNLKSQRLTADPRVICLDDLERKVLVGLTDGTIVMLFIEDLSLVRNFEVHFDWVVGLKFDWVRKESVSCSLDKKIKIFDLEKAQERKKLLPHTSWISCICWTKDQKFFASGSNDMCVKLWRQEDEEYYLASYAGHNGMVTSVKFTRSEKFLVSVANCVAIVWKIVDFK